MLIEIKSKQFDEGDVLFWKLPFLPIYWHLPVYVDQGFYLKNHILLDTGSRFDIIFGIFAIEKSSPFRPKFFYLICYKISPTSTPNQICFGHCLYKYTCDIIKITKYTNEKFPFLLSRFQMFVDHRRR